MHSLDFLRDLIVIFGVSVLVVLVLHRLRLPSITGFLITGILLGPHGLSLVSDVSRIEVLADAGVIMLLFTVGIEFSLVTLRRLWGTALTGAVLPVLVSAALACAVAPALGLARGQGIFLGFLVVLSSTVIPMKALADRGQLDSPHGRTVIGVAVLQDLLVVPMMLMTPYLTPGRAPGAGGSWAALLVDPALALLQAAAVLGGFLLVALWGVPRALARLAALKSREVFIISIFLICLGTAWITSLAGLSLALGAFLAGLVISESEFGHQALADVVPFRDSLSSLFFVSVGMLMDPRLLLEKPFVVLASVMGIIIFKPILIGGLLLLAGQRPTVAVQVGLALAQVGEFAFVLMRFGSGFHLIPEAAGQIFLSASVITMIVTPLLLAASPPLLGMVRRWEENGWWRPAKDLRLPVQPAAPLQDHVVIVGYGFNGRNLARVLKEIEIPYVVLDMNPLTVRQARAEGENIVYGDASSHGILERLGAAEARVLVLAISDPVLTRRAAAVASRSFPGLHVLVRTRYLSEVDELYALGADGVIPEEVETSVEVFSRVLEQYGVPRETLVKHARRIRAERYGLFRGGRPASVPVGPAAEVGLSDLRKHFPSSQVMLCTIPAECPAVGRSLLELDLLRSTGAAVLAVLRNTEVLSAPSFDARLHAGDSVVLLGSPEQVGAAFEALIGPAG